MVIMETVRVAVFLSVCLSVLCQGQRSLADDEENAGMVLGLSQKELVSPTKTCSNPIQTCQNPSKTC